jgi:CRISPR/Cas system-associated endoribonuclease Cas2
MCWWCTTFPTTVGKLHDTPLNCGTPVQYGVFECLLDEKELARIKKATAKVVRPRVDRVRYCVGKTEVLGGVEVLEGPEAPVV